MLITLIFILVLLSAGGVFGYQKYLIKQISEKDQKLQDNIDQLEPDQIEELAVVDSQIELTKDILSDHLVPSRFFTHLQEITLQKVRFGDFSYLATPGNQPEITMSGVAPDYQTVALQSDLFARDEYLASSFFSGLNLDDDGKVSFEIDAKASQRLTSYKN